MDREKPGTLASRTPIRESQEGSMDMGASDPAGLPDTFWSRVDGKRTGINLHERARDAAGRRSAEAELETHWLQIAEEGSLRLDHTDGGLELRACGHDKGRAASSLIGRCPPRTIAVFVG